MPAISALKAPTKFAYLFVTDGGLRRRCIASNHYGEFALNRHNQWAWIVGMMVAEFGCNPDGVHCEENDEGEEFITVEGEPVGFLVIE